jgi:hypothetical protein
VVNDVDVEVLSDSTVVVLTCEVDGGTSTVEPSIVGTGWSIAQSVGIDVVSHPDTANDPENMMLIAADYWTTNKLNTYADDWRITELSKRIVGDTRTAAARLAWCNLALKTYEGLEKLAK